MGCSDRWVTGLCVVCWSKLSALGLTHFCKWMLGTVTQAEDQLPFPMSIVVSHNSHHTKQAIPRLIDFFPVSTISIATVHINAWCSGKNNYREHRWNVAVTGVIDKDCTHLSGSWISNQTKIFCVLFEKDPYCLLVALQKNTVKCSLNSIFLWVRKSGIPWGRSFAFFSLNVKLFCLPVQGKGAVEAGACTESLILWIWKLLLSNSWDFLISLIKNLS